MKNVISVQKRFVLVSVILLIFMAAAWTVSAGSGPWWDVDPEEENPSPYYDSILY